MIGSDTLLFPDTGPEFLKSLRTAVLYSKHVHVLTLLDPALANTGAEGFKPVSPENPIGYRRLSQYFIFLKKTLPDLTLLKNEGIILPLGLDDDSFDKATCFRNNAYKSINQKIETVHEKKSYLNELFDLGIKHCPPSYFDLDLLGIYSRVARGKTKWNPTFADQESICKIGFIPYLLMVNAIAEDRGVGLSTWLPEFQNALWGCRELFSTNPSQSTRKITQRKDTEVQLGNIIFDKYLPVADDLPFEELLKIRETRADELEAFRVALSELATHVDLNQSRDDYELQIHDLVSSKVDPAIQVLRSALTDSRLDSLKKVGRSWKSLASATIPAVLTFAAGAPLDVSAVVAALGTIGMPLAEGILDRKKLVHASQWSILFRLNKMNKGSELHRKNKRKKK